MDIVHLRWVSTLSPYTVFLHCFRHYTEKISGCRLARLGRFERKLNLTDKIDLRLLVANVKDAPRTLELE